MDMKRKGAKPTLRKGTDALRKGEANMVILQGLARLSLVNGLNLTNGRSRAYLNGAPCPTRC
jgi:hypothetical protein